MKENHIEVPRTARYFELGASAADATEVWYVCHGYRQLANRFLHRFRGFATATRLIVAPEGGSRFYVEGGDEEEHTPSDRVGASWMTREDRENEITDYVRYLDLLCARIESGRGTPMSRRVVLGFSQGTHTVCRWVTLGEVKPDELILWGGYLPKDLPDGAIEILNRTRVTIVRGKTDPYVTDDAHARQISRMKEMGLRFEVLQHSGSHAIYPDTLKLLGG